MYTKINEYKNKSQITMFFSSTPLYHHSPLQTQTIFFSNNTLSSFSFNGGYTKVTLK